MSQNFKDDPLAESEMSEEDSESKNSEESIDILNRQSSIVSETQSVKKKKWNPSDAACLIDDPKAHDCWKSWLKCRARDWINDEA